MLSNSQQFWKTQVTHMNESLPIVKTPTPLISPLEWVELDIRQEKDLCLLHTFLSKYYGTPDKSLIVYSRNYLQWALNDHNPSIALGIRCGATLVAFCKGYCINMSVNSTVSPFFVTSFLCIHPKYRGKRLVNLLVKEMLRRMFLLNIRFGMSISIKDIHQKVCQVDRYRRILRPKAFFDAGYSRPNLTLQRANKLFTVPVSSGRFSVLTLEDLPLLTNYMNRQLSKFKLFQQFDIPVAERVFMSNSGVNRTLVSFESKDTLNGMFSYHILDLKVGHVILKAAYILYAIGENIIEAYEQLMADAFKEECDMVVAFNCMEFEQVIQKLKFEQINAVNYFIFNDALTLRPSEVGFIWF